MVLRLNAHHPLPDGTRVRLRLPHGRDRRLLFDLLGRLGLRAGELDIVRALRFDPATETVVCATVWSGSADTMVGLAAGPRGGRPARLLLADEALAPGLGDVLRMLVDGSAAGRRNAA